MDHMIDENIDENSGNNRRLQKPMANERRVLAPILSKGLNVLTEKIPKYKPTKGLQQKPKLWPTNETVATKAVAEPKKSNNNTFEIFCDQLDSEFNTSNIENHFDITIDEIKEDFESCERTDNLLSERTETSLAIEEVVIDGFSEHDIRCEETVDIPSEDEDEELEDVSVYDRTSEAVRSFSSTALSICKEYAEEIHKYLVFYERTRMADPFYIGKQPEINAKMRSILVDWIVEVSEEYKLLDETLFLAVNYIDRFLSLMSVSRQSFQLLGTAALFIAAKYEEIYPPELTEFVYITDDSYTKQQILNMEKLILKGLKFDVSAPTTYYFTDKYCSDLGLESIVKHLAKYLSHLTLLESEPFLRYYPSEIAVCSIILSAQTLGFSTLVTKEFINKTMAFEKELKSGDIGNFIAERQACIEALHRMHAFAHKHPQQAIQTKYSLDKHYRVAIIEPMSTSPRIY